MRFEDVWKLAKSPDVEGGLASEIWGGGMRPREKLLLGDCLRTQAAAAKCICRAMGGGHGN